MDLLPKEIIPTVLCYTLCSDCEDEVSDRHEKAEIAICNANGYLLEFSGKKVINSCYILIEDASKLLLYCNLSRGRCMVYYLVRNDNGVLVIVKKSRHFLMVVRCFNNIKDCKVFDFQNKGHPQLGVYQFDSKEVKIMNFSEFDDYTAEIDKLFPGNEIEKFYEVKDMDEEDDVNEFFSETDEEVVTVGGNKNIVEFLSKKLEAIKQYNNELSYEIYKMDEILRKGIENLTMNKSSNSHLIKFTKSWSRIHHDHWILGIEFWSSGKGNVNDIKIVTTGRDFTSYSYRFFSQADDMIDDTVMEKDELSERMTEDNSETMDYSSGWESVAGGSRKDEVKPTFGCRTQKKSIAVVAFRVPNFDQRSVLPVSLSFIWGKCQFHTETFHLRTENFFQEQFQVFRTRNEISLTEDVMACLVVREETALIVEMRYSLGISLENVLTEKLGFSRAKILGEDFYLKETGDLCGTTVSVKRIWNDLVSWNLRIFASNENILRILIGEIYNELPMPVRIRLQA